MSARKATIEAQDQGDRGRRQTVALDGGGAAAVATGLASSITCSPRLATHARFDLTLACKGDLHIDDHHTAEDCALALGQALRPALGEARHRALRPAPSRRSTRRWPARSSTSRAALRQRRPRPRAPRAGRLASHDRDDVMDSFAMPRAPGASRRRTATITTGASAFKALALALRQAVSRDGTAGVPSTKGVL